jgi:hypothetical protein
MGTTTRSGSRELEKLLWAQKDLLSRAQALNEMTTAALRHRLRPAGPWRIVLPGIYLATSGLPTIGQREMAALLYCGSESVITGTAALERRGIRVPSSEMIDVLVPASMRRQTAGFVTVHQDYPDARAGLGDGWPAVRPASPGGRRCGTRLD